jgi:hypothetical protein
VDSLHFAPRLGIAVDADRVAPVGCSKASATPSRRLTPRVKCSYRLAAVPLRIEKGELLF